MQVFDKLKENKGLAIALGYFDGVHIGHQAVIKSAVDYAKINNTKSAVITFKDHPCCYFYGVCPKYILSRDDREKRIADLGVDYLFELDFDAKLCFRHWPKQNVLHVHQPLLYYRHLLQLTIHQ